LSKGLSRTARVAWIAAAVLLVSICWIAISHNAGIAFFLGIPIGLCAWWFGPRAGLAMAAASTCLYALGAAIQTVPELGVALTVRGVFFLAVAAVASAVGERLRALEHSAEELEAIRAALAPADLPDLPGIDAAAAFVPSELGVSGDFYLLTNGPDGSALAIVGDVVGHGPAAARLATFVRARFAALAASTSDPAELLAMANLALLDRPGRGRELVSAICLRLAADGERLTWARAGHPRPLRLPQLEELGDGESTFLLGASRKLDLQNADTPVAGGQGFVVYTDGATDVRRGRELLGLEGLARMLAPLNGLNARTIASEVERAILAWADRPIRDDLCLVVLKPVALLQTPG
jgi:serine phosphatase RsbU (regulator of sigma subunit)